MRYIELFAGVGGFRLGIDRAYLKYDLSGPECVFANDFDKPAAVTYNRNFGGELDTRDITTIATGDIAEHELAVGGFPCQAFSVAGQRRGFLDATRGTLFFDVARILRDKRPRHFVLENVKGLLSHDSGKTFQTIIGVLADLGYDVEWQVLNSKDFGVPQNRERIFIVGHLGGECGRTIFPIEGEVRPYSEPSVDAAQPAQAIATRHLDRNGGLVSPIASTVQATETPHVIGTINRGQFKETGDRSLTVVASYYKGEDNHGARPVVLTGNPKYRDGKRSVEYQSSDVVPTIRATQFKNGDNQPRILQRGRGKNAGGSHDVAPSITGKSYQDNNYLEDAPRIRRLTPKECERLQGFPDDFTLGVSNTQRYKQMGNAVTVNVVEAVICAMLAKGCIM